MIKENVPEVYPSYREDFETVFARENILARFAAGERDIYMEYQKTGKDGRYHWLSVQIIYVENPFNDDVLAIELLKVLDSQRAEQARQELLPAVPGEESTRPEPLLSADEERRLRGGTARGERELDEAIQEAVAEGRGIRQQVREQMLRTEREWVVNVPEKDIELEKTLGGD